MKKIIAGLCIGLSSVLIMGTISVMAQEAAFDSNGFAVVDFENEVPVHTELQKEALANIDTFNDYCDGFTELSYPETVVISWAYDTSAQEVPEVFYAYISINEDLSDAIIIACETEGKDEYSVEITNLFIGTTYYYAVEANGELSDVHSFTTEADAPRNLYVDTITNVRDLGGWEIEGGGRVRQGMIYRTGRLNGTSSDKEETRVIISEEGLEVMRNKLGIKTELDIRADGENEDITESVLGSDVNYIFIPFENITKVEENEEVIRDIIKVFAVEENYPIAYHCTIGTDRTGFIAFLINGLLGVSEENLCRDYLFSNMALISGHRDAKRFQKHDVDRVINENGDNLSQKITNYLLKIGVTEEEINSIIDIMIEK